MALDQQLRELAEKHKLTSISIGILHIHGEYWVPNVSVQGGGKCAIEGNCGSTITEALELALTELARRRSPAVVIPDLEAVA